MKRLGLIVVVLMLAVVLYRPATSQDNYEERIASLETRVTVLEGRAADPDKEGGSESSGGGDYSITGLVQISGIRQTDVVTKGGTCGGGEGSRFEGIQFGGEVLVYDAAGGVLGSGEFATGTIAAESLSRASCTLPFQVDNLPHANSYRVVFGTKKYYAEYARFVFEAADWYVELNI